MRPGTVSLLVAIALLAAGCGGHGGLRIESGPRPAPNGQFLREMPEQPTPSVCARSAAFRAASGEVAFLDRGALDVLDLASCRVRRVVSRDASGPVRFSPDGRWIAYGQAVVASPGSRQLLRPLDTELATGPGAWTWSPREDALTGVTAAGGVVAGGPARAVRHLLPDGWGATGIAMGASGELAISRSSGSGHPDAEIWELSAEKPSPRLLYRDTSPGATLQLLRFTSDSGWLLFSQSNGGSASLAADGVPLFAVPASGGIPTEVAPRVLTDPDLVADCIQRSVLSESSGRETSFGTRLVATSPPAWRSRPITSRRLSFASPTCSPDGRWVAAAAGPSRHERAFGEEGRSIWLLRPAGANLRELTAPPPAGVSDEAPRWSRDARFLLFVRSGPTRSNAQSRGELYLAPTRGHHETAEIGPLARLGPTSNYYGHYDWATDLDWYQP